RYPSSCPHVNIRKTAPHSTRDAAPCGLFRCALTLAPETIHNFCNPLLGVLFQLQRRLPVAHHHHVQIGNYDGILPLIAIGREAARPRKAKPPMRTVGRFRALLLPCRRARIVHPAFRQKTLSFPHAIAEIEKAEPRKVSWGAEAEG